MNYLRVAWVQDLNFWVQPGGAERTDKQIVIAGLRRGHEIDTITPERFPPASTIKCDLVVFSNIHTLMQTNKEQMEKLAEQKPFVMWHHDYWCRFRLYYPMLEKCKRCIYLPPWRKLYGRSTLNIWMSPLHRDANLFSMPELATRPYALAPSGLNPKDYTHEQTADPEPNTVIGVNSLFGFKGSVNVLKYAEKHPELSFTFAGGSEVTMLPPNCRYVGFKEREELLKLYAEHEALIHLPSTCMPCDRVIAEFLIANPKGKLITNNCVGILSYPNVVQDGKVNREEIIRLVSTGPQTFWEKVEEAWKT